MSKLNFTKKCRELEDMSDRFDSIINDLLSIGQKRVAEIMQQAQQDLLAESHFLWNEARYDNRN